MQDDEVEEPEEVEPHRSRMCCREGGWFHRRCTDFNCQCDCHDD